MTNNVGFTFSVGDITPRFTISIEQNKKLLTLNIIFTVAFKRFEDVVIFTVAVGIAILQITLHPETAGNL